MALQKHDIPILEYDTAQRAVIMPGNREIRYPEKAAFLFLGDATEAYAAANACEKTRGLRDDHEKRTPSSRPSMRARKSAFCQAPLGAPAAVQILEHLIGSGVRKIIAAGTCGALVDIAENEFLVPVEAVRDEGTSYHYLPPARTIALDAAGVDAVRRALLRHGLGVGSAASGRRTLSTVRRRKWWPTERRRAARRLIWSARRWPRAPGSAARCLASCFSRRTPSPIPNPTTRGDGVTARSTGRSRSLLTRRRHFNPRNRL